MKFGKTLLYLIFSLLGFTDLSAQSRELNFGVQIYNFSGTKLEKLGSHYSVTELNDAIGQYPFGLGWSIPLYHINDDLTLGLLPSINIGVGSLNSGNVLTTFIPTYLSLRYGAGANRSSSKSIGCGFNLGVQHNFLFLEKSLKPDGNGFLYYLTPEAGVEVSFDFGSRAHL